MQVTYSNAQPQGSSSSSKSSNYTFPAGSLPRKSDKST